MTLLNYSFILTLILLFKTNTFTNQNLRVYQNENNYPRTIIYNSKICALLDTKQE